METAYRRWATLAMAIRILAVFDAVTFLAAALLHLGAHLPLGFAVIIEPRILPAAIVEGLAGAVFAVSAYAVFNRHPWARPVVIASHVYALAGVLLGMFALAAGLGPRTDLNDLYHRVMFVVLAAGLTELLTPTGKAALGRGARASLSQ